MKTILASLIILISMSWSAFAFDIELPDRKFDVIDPPVCITVQEAVEYFNPMTWKVISKTPLNPHVMMFIYERVEDKMHLGLYQYQNQVCAVGSGYWKKGDQT